MTMVEKARAGLFDRTSHISNPIYSSIDGRDDKIPEEEYRSRLRSFRPIIVFCCLKDQQKMVDKMLGEKGHKPQEYVDLVKSRHPQIVQMYKNMMQSYEGILPIINYEWDLDHPMQVLETIRAIHEPDRRRVF